MAKVPLRKYNSEIESLIERGQTDEAIAHCRHILQTFPKHLETYRLLGKAYLESKRHSEATDIFNRVLMSVPDDFVSHVGLSIIADEQKRLEDAIWHMERAFEKQPSNAAIHAELQRLYGRRDGREPPKIRLTRGALAHMYYQGELYMQAVSEISAVLNEEPSRTDLQPLLALAYFRAGQKVEASETCTKLLSQFPYCFDANRALIEILPGTGMAESANTYRQRVVELDPYAAHVRGSIFQTADVPDNAVSLERLDYKGQPVETNPDWGKSLGIGLDAASATNEQPDWMKSNYPTESVAPFTPAFDTPPATYQPAASTPSERGPFEDSSAQEQEAEDIPDWMRKAGWGASSGAFDESAAAVAEEPAEGELAKADLPDWIKSMAPKETPAPAPVPVFSSSDDDTLDWLNKLGGDSAFASENPSEETLAEPPQAMSSVDVPDWLSSFDKPVQEPASPVSPADSPDWLSKFDSQSQESVSPAAPAEPSDWVSEMGGAASVTASAAATSTADWLSKLDDETPASGPAQESTPAATNAEAGIGSLGTSAAEQDAAMLWLESLAAKQGAKSEELITNPDERLEAPPEWVEQAKAVGESLPAEPVAVDPTPDLTGAWLRDLEEKDSLPEKPVEIEKETDTWSGEIEIAPSSAEQFAESALEADLPSWLRGLQDQTPSESGSREEMPDWLKGDEPEVPSVPEPTHPADWAPEAPKVAPRPAAPKPEARKAAVRKPEPKPEAAALAEKTKVRRTGMLPPLIDPNLAFARDAMSHGKIPDALQAYGNLIRKGKLLEDITFDLKEALYRFPVEVSIWQALGDAYMRANRLQDALDAYTKAEELLR